MEWAVVINTLSLHVHRADMLDTDGTESLDWAQVASFVAATSANSAIVGASDLDPDGVKASLHALDEDGNGTVSLVRAAHIALRKVVGAQLE